MNIRLHCSNFIKTLNTKNKDQIIKDYLKASQENKHQALMIVFYARSLYGGGLRHGPMEVFKYISEKQELTNELMLNIVKYGCFKDLREIYLVASPINKEKILWFWMKELKKGNKLAIKWTPRKGPLFYKLSNNLGYKNVKVFRHFLTSSYFSLERKMCERKWNKISLSKASQKALYVYNEILSKHLGFQIRFFNLKGRPIYIKKFKKWMKFNKY